MTTEGNAKSKNFNLYELLNCDTTASFEELKKCYQNLIREWHPDKQQNKANNADHQRFLEIDRAWKTLRDEELRKQYDASLMKEEIENHSVVYAELRKSDIDFNQNGTASYPCRCGNEFIIEKDCLEDNDCDEYFIECSECSNCIVIK